MDITYNIIPHVYKPYKLLTIKGFDIQDKQPNYVHLYV